MQRRDFLKTSSAAVALSALHTNACAAARRRARRLDRLRLVRDVRLLRLIRRPSKCSRQSDVDTRCTTRRGLVVNGKAQQEAAILRRFPQMLADHKFDIVLSARPTIGTRWR
jgi:hypothetical protein